MSKLLNISLCGIVFAIWFAAFIHEPIPPDCPDGFAFQMLVDYLSFAETLAGLTEYISYNRWWTYPARPFSDSFIYYIELMFNSHAETAVSWVNLAGVNSILVIPKDCKESKKPTRAVVFYHGGGWIFGSAGSYVDLLMIAAKQSGSVVVSPDYRRAPEFPFPVPYEDCLNSTLAFIQRAREFNVDPEKIAIMGDSAGGNLAMAITNTLIEMNEIDHDVPAPKMMVLVYPIIQMLDFQLPSYRFNAKYVFYPELVPKFWLAYAGLNEKLYLSKLVARNLHVNYSDAEISTKLNLVSSDIIPHKYTTAWNKSQEAPLPKLSENNLIDDETREKIKQLVLDPRMAPLMLPDDALMKMPRTHIMVCQYDPLRDDGIIAAERIRRAGGGEVTLQLLESSLHAALNIGAMTSSMSYHARQNAILFEFVRSYVN